MEFANTDKVGSKTRPLQKRLAKDRRDSLEVSGRVRSMTLANYLQHRWLPLVSLGVEPCTAVSYRQHVANYIVPHLGHIRVGKLQRSQIQRFYADLLHEDSLRKGRPLSKGSVIRIHAVLHSALEDLVSAGQLVSNPAHGARPRHTKSERHEYRIWTQRQVEEFIAAAKPDPMFALWRLLAFTGMRRSEVIGLKREDVRLESRQLSVRRAVVIADRDLYVTRPKSDAERVIELDVATAGALRTHLRRQNRLFPGGEWLFTDRNGEILHPEHVSQRFKHLVATTDLPRIRLHDLRHTHASHLILAGVNVKAVQERLGHSDVVVTLNIYSHVLPTTQRDAVKQLESFYRRG